MPVFFVIAEIGANLAALGLSGVGVLALVAAVAVSGKFIGTLGACRVLGVGFRRSLPLAALLSTRGLTELVVLSIGVQLGLLDHRTYSIMVIMALLTTAMTGPLLDGFGARACRRRDRPAGSPREAILSWLISHLTAVCDSTWRRCVTTRDRRRAGGDGACRSGRPGISLILPAKAR